MENERSLISVAQVKEPTRTPARRQFHHTIPRAIVSSCKMHRSSRHSKPSSLRARCSHSSHTTTLQERAITRCPTTISPRHAKTDDPHPDRESHSILPRPFAGSCVVLLPIALVDPRNLRHQRIVRIRVRQQRADRQQHLRHRERGTPLVLQNIQADASVAVHVAVVDARREVHLCTHQNENTRQELLSETPGGGAGERRRRTATATATRGPRHAPSAA
jgi:hypothetical protein